MDTTGRRLSSIGLLLVLLPLVVRRGSPAAPRDREPTDLDGDASSGIATKPPNERVQAAFTSAATRQGHAQSCAFAERRRSSASSSSMPEPDTRARCRALPSTRPRRSPTRRGASRSSSARGRAASTTHASRPRAAARGTRRSSCARSARRASRSRRAADQHVAGIQLRGRRLWYENADVHTHRPRRGRSSTAVCRRTTTATTAASSAGSRVNHKQADFLSDDDLDRIAAGPALARAYDLIVFSGPRGVRHAGTNTT